MPLGDLLNIISTLGANGVLALWVWTLQKTVWQQREKIQSLNKQAKERAQQRAQRSEDRAEVIEDLFRSLKQRVNES